ncbi:NAD(P)-binding domain-containing protein [Streptomyces sp. DSM 44915]|uniref:NAD(P)-binding domain-containing protein n=1 Tax=Streptomyces chisholmiae TaxID=3075540 RepID=A0ABU2K068_9ACTN|nr:NAD(P)-binding domain-containing protein [Streptomyces sp. DSM 44915]MDT0270396.1 NAD(P)-binding domain-containing protein [Streptomyces sp. DSM 44915]
MTSTTPSVTAPVTVLGLGPMGRSLAEAFLAAGHPTTVWNRTAGRDRELLARGAHGAATAAEAVTASELVVICVLDNAAVEAVLAGPGVAEALAGRTVVNLSADTPARARQLAAWAAEHGVDYLDGAIMTPVTTIGTPDAVYLHSGPEELYRRHLPTLTALGPGHSYLGAEIGRAAAHDLALLDIFWSAMSGYAHALAVARAEGVTGRELAPFAQGIVAILPPIFEALAGDLDDGTFSGEDNPLTSAASSMAHVIEASESHGIDAGVMRAAEGLARRVIGLGHGEGGFIRTAELLNPRA